MTHLISRFNIRFTNQIDLITTLMPQNLDESFDYQNNFGISATLNTRGQLLQLREQNTQNTGKHREYTMQIISSTQDLDSF